MQGWLKSKIATVANLAVEGAQQVGQFVMDTFSGAMDRARSAAMSVKDAVFNAVADLGQFVTDGFTSAIEWAKAQITELLGFLNFEEVIGQARAVFQQKVESVKQFFTETKDFLLGMVGLGGQEGLSETAGTRAVESSTQPVETTTKAPVPKPPPMSTRARMEGVETPVSTPDVGSESGVAQIVEGVLSRLGFGGGGREPVKVQADQPQRPGLDRRTDINDPLLAITNTILES